MIEEITPVPVHVKSSDVSLTPVVPPARRKASTFHTVLLSLTNPIQDLLSQQADRCEAYVIQYGDADIVICHSQADANRVSGDPDYSKGVAGAIIAKGFMMPVPVRTTDRVFVTANSAALAATAQSVGSVAGAGSASAPGAGGNIVTVAAASLPAGTYSVSVVAYIDGTIVPATDDDNMRLNPLGTRLAVGATAVGSGPYTVVLNGAQNLQVVAIAAASGAAVYHAQITATPLGASSGAIKVGVVEILYAKD
jgi:hypothetical protein